MPCYLLTYYSRTRGLFSRSGNTSGMTHWTERLFEEQADLYADFFAARFDGAALTVDSDTVALLAR